MKEITKQDCFDLKTKFDKYCETAEQHQFPLLLMVNIKLDQTLDDIKKFNKLPSQETCRAMFRVVLKVIGEIVRLMRRNNMELYVKGELPKSCWECPCF